MITGGGVWPVDGGMGEWGWWMVGGRSGACGWWIREWRRGRRLVGGRLGVVCLVDDGLGGYGACETGYGVEASGAVG